MSTLKLVVSNERPRDGVRPFRFEMSRKGCEQAIAYLKSLDLYDDFMKYGDLGSADGFTLIAVANRLYEAEEKG